MKKFKFSDIIGVRKVTTCTSCESYVYRVPFPITKQIENFLVAFGPLRYPLNKVQIIKMENIYIYMFGRCGQNELRIKFKKNAENQKKLFDVQIAAYVSQEQNCEIIMG